MLAQIAIGAGIGAGIGLIATAIQDMLQSGRQPTAEDQARIAQAREQFVDELIDQGFSPEEARARASAIAAKMLVDAVEGDRITGKDYLASALGNAIGGGLVAGIGPLFGRIGKAVIPPNAKGPIKPGGGKPESGGNTEQTPIQRPLEGSGGPGSGGGAQQQLPSVVDGQPAGTVVALQTPPAFRSKRTIDMYPVGEGRFKADPIYTDPETASQPGIRTSFIGGSDAPVLLEHIAASGVRDAERNFPPIALHGGLALGTNDIGSFIPRRISQRITAAEVRDAEKNLPAIALRGGPPPAINDVGSFIPRRLDQRIIKRIDPDKSLRKELRKDPANAEAVHQELFFRLKSDEDFGKLPDEQIRDIVYSFIETVLASK